MKAKVGDAITMTTERVGQVNRQGVIREVHGADGGPPYLVEWSDGHTGLINPGPGSVKRIGEQAGGKTAT
ncbi:MAG: DUF1918 domain-containing protein [Intrasporangium sp.]|uniref:DUF1918 domain-containing protein n=1 Tax=Intrasporangium sp. TaxID=1925024 RepID=UPI0026482C03|nr:DUF1918 domain-containing protein [Intrasporangium sp.]MDN5795164.1 DUF1918 domain-containing protein [Intrasporangium sp.]